MASTIKFNPTEFDRIAGVLIARKNAADAALTRLIMAAGHKPKDKVVVGQQLYWRHFIQVCNDLLAHFDSITVHGYEYRTDSLSVGINSERSGPDNSQEDSEWVDI